MANDLVMPVSPAVVPAVAEVPYPNAANLSAVDIKNARDYRTGAKYADSPDVCDWFTSYTGTRTDRSGKTAVNSLQGYAWVKSITKYFPAKATELFSFLYEKNGEGKSVPVGKPIAYRMWGIVPSLDLTDEASVIAWDKGERPLSFRVVAQATIAAVTKGKVKILDKDKKPKRYNVPRLSYKNCIIVDVEQEVDGQVLPTRVRANFGMRLMFENRRAPKVFFTGADKKQKETYQKVFTSASLRKLRDCTDDFLTVFALVEGKDVDDKIHNTLAQFFVNPQLAGTPLAKIMRLQAFSAAGAMADSAAPALKRRYDLSDRVGLFVARVRDCYFGIEHYEGKNADSEFTDFYCRIMSIEDPLVMDAQRLAGRVRLNDGVKVTLSE